MVIMLDQPAPQLMTRIAELISPVGRPRRAAQLNCPAELLTKELPLAVKRTVPACRLPASELGYVCTLQNSTVHGMREVISMPSACNQRGRTCTTRRGCPKRYSCSIRTCILAPR